MRDEKDPRDEEHADDESGEHEEPERPYTQEAEREARHAEGPLHEGDGDSGLFGRFTRKLRDRRELTDDAWRAVGAVLTTSDRAKSDFIRMLGREVRHYLDGLQLTEDLRELVTSHSLEVHASLHLKPLPKEDGEEEPPKKKAKPAKKPAEDE